MNERRVSLGNRALSLLLALVMVIGMLPLSVLSVFAAETTTDVSVTQQNIAKIENYAQNMLKNNFTVYGDVDWATEGNDVWKYFNGVMLRAFLMMGVNSDNDVTNSTGNALEYVSGYLDSSITEGTAKPSGYKDTELDSVPPARMLFFLLDSSVDADKYEASIHYVYNCLNTIATGHPYPYNGGNLLHKPGWEGDWEIGLDGIYMAQPFLLEYANAVENEDIDNKYNIDPAALRTQVYTRLIWVADNMATKVDTVNGVDYYLYNHGCKAKDKESDTLQLNGQYWSRGIGWYAAGLVDCIELMPAGTQKNDLIARLPKLFDGMIHYQDTTGGKIDSGNNTGMWYNLVNGVKYTGSKTSNELETSGTALMAYSLLKAYNNDWVTADTYKNAGLRAFNGIVNNKVTGSENSYVVGGIYKQSGVSSAASDYGQYSYVNHEAKGTGPVIMAAVEASRAIGTAEKDVIGVVSAPGGMTVPVGAAAADLDYSNVKLTVVSNFGNVETKIAPYVSAVSISDTSAVGTATVTLYSKQDADLVLDTFTVQVVDPSDPITAEGAITVTGEVSDSNKYVQVTALSIGKNYVFTKTTTGTTVDAAGASSSGGLTGWKVAGNSSASNGVYTLTASSGTLCHWHIDKNNRIYTVISGKNYYVKVTGTGASDRELTDVETDGTVFTMSSNSNKVLATDKVNNRNLVVDSAGLKTGSNSTSNGIFAYEQQTTGTSTLPVILSVQPNTVNLDANGTYDLTTTVTVGGNAVSLSDCTISWGTSASGVATVSGGKITGVADGSATITATLTAVKINGESKNLDKAISVNIAVNVGDGTATEPVTYTAKFYYGNGTELTSATTLNVKVGETLKLYIKVTDSNGTDVTSSWVHGWKANKAATADIVDASGNSVTSGAVVYLKGVAAGNASFNVQTAQDAAGTNKSELYIPVTVQADETEVTYSYTLANISDATIDVGGSVTPSFSVTSGGQDVTANFAMSLSSNNTDVAAIEGNKVVGKSAGTATITVTVAKAVSTLAVETTNEIYTTTFNVTVNAVAEDEVAAPVTGQITTTITTTGSGSGSTVEYVLYSSEDYSSVPAGNYIIVYSTNGTSGKALTNVTTNVGEGTIPATPADVIIAGGKITSTINGYTVWTVGSDSYVGNGSNYLQDGQNTKLLNKKGNANAISFAVDSGTADGWLIYLQDGRPMGWGSSNNFERLSSGATGVKVFLFKETTVPSGSSTSTTIYNADLTASDISMTVGQTGVSATKPGITVKKAADNSAATPTSYAVTYAVTGGDNCITITSDGAITANSAGTAHVTATLSAIDMGEGDDVINTPAKVTFKVVVTSSGSDTPSTGSEYIHIFETHGKDSSFYTIIGDNLSDSKGTATVNDTTYDTCLKMNGNAEITFNASAAGTLTLVFNTGSAGKTIDVNGTIYTIPENGVITAAVPAGANTVKRSDGESFLYYMAFAENSNVVAYSLSDLVFDPTSVNAGQGVSVSTTFSATDNQEHTYTIQWKIDGNNWGDPGQTPSTGFTPMDAGEYTVTATLTHVDGTELATPVTKTGTITVADAVATGGSLNNASVTVTQGTDITLSTLSANITFSNDTTATVNLSQSGFTFKKNGSDISITDVDATVGTHTIAVYYNGVSIGNLTVTVNAPVTGTSEVSYVLDTDGIIEDDSEYLIVGIYNGTYYALTCNSSTTAESTVVVPENGVITLEEDVASKVLWHFANQNADLTANNVTYDCFQISNNGYYLQSGGANFSNSATSVYAAKVGDSDGSYEIALKIESGLPRALYCSSTSGWSRNSASADRNRVVYLYKKVEAQSYVTLEKLPMLYIGGTPVKAKLSDYVSSVSYNGTTYTDYEIQWTSGNSAVAYITDDDGQYVNGAGAGTAQLVAKLMSVGGKDVSAENIVATVDVSVTVPSLELGEDVTKFVGESFTAERQVLIGSTAVENYVLKWTTSNDTVATVDEATGLVTIVGEGTATIYAQIVSTNGNNISEYLTINDSFTVTAEEIAITSGKLSSETVTVALGADAAAVESALSGITLTLTKNNGETILVDHATLFDGVDLSGVNTAAAGTYYVDLTYSDPNSDYVFNGVVAVMVIDESLLDKEGVITVESGVTYVLDTDGIDANEEYVIVKQNSDGKWVAMMNPDADGSGSKKGSSQEVTRSSDGKTITVSANADLVRWMFTNKSTTTSNGFTYNTFTVMNNNRYLKGGGDSILGSSSNKVGVWYAGDGSGSYYVGTDYSSGKARALILSGDSWTRDDSAYPDDSDERVYMYKRVGTGTTYAVGFQVSPTEKTIPEGTSFTVPESGIRVQVGDTEAESYKIEWTTSNSSVATVDENGKITAKGAGSCTITATLVEANGSKVTNNATNTVGIPKEIAVTVQADQLTYTLVGSPLTVPLGGEPDFSKVSLLIDSTLAEDITVPSDQLVFKYIDAVVGGFDPNEANDTCTVDVYYNGNLLEQKLVLKVADNAYDGLDQATSYPEYPDPGAVRMDKFATGVNFNTTGVAKIELNAAGISSRKPVDVVLIVDVSNSMNWSMDWFEGMTAEEIAAANDAAKTDSSKPDKLDMAMTAAQNFASILMENNVANSPANNTMTFVTFGGNDLDRGGPSKSVDSVVTAFVGEDVLANVNNSFANTMFTGSQNLKISGTDGNAIVSGDARGNTIYDAAFVEAMAAVEQLKIAKAGSVAAYDASGREVHIVFMTDGAPSHYNDKCYDNSNTHGSWFTKFSPSDSNTPDDTEWLNFIKNPNADATELYNMVTGFHIVGYDLAHGGFGKHNWTEAELGRVLGGLVENKALDYTLATDTEKLNTFFDELGHSLAYAGTHALVTDIVSEEFILQTDLIDLYGDKSEMLAPTIEIVERQLVVRTDIGKTMNIQGVGNVTVTEEHLGMYVDGGEKILATVTFDTTDEDNKKAFSTALDDGEDIWNDTTNIITGKYFTYSFSNKTFEWKIGNIEDTEIALTYYGYLTGAKNAEGEGGRAEGIYATNEEATLKYINTDNQIVIREYPVPRIAWGKASATVRFFLVDGSGKYTNLAGTTFTNPANRIFLVNSATYQFDLNTNPNSLLPGVITAQDAFTKAAVSNQYALYDDVTMNVTNSTMQNVNGSASITAGVDKSNTEALVEFIDVNGDGSYIQTVINIPVVSTGRQRTETPLTEETVVLDYAKAIDVQIFNLNELKITDHGYKMELYGFAAYDPTFDTHLYLLPDEYSGKELAEGTYFDAGFGKFKIVDKAKGIIEFQPTSIAQGPVQVFAIAKITKSDNEANVYYLYNPVTMVPATTVYYETDFAAGVFTTAATKGSWTTATEGNTGATLQDADPDVNRRDDELNGVPHVKDAYGSDSSYAGDNKLSGGSSLKAAGAGVNDTTVSFSFTGTGFDIISRTGAAQGMIRVNVTDSKNNLVKTVRVTNQGTNELYQIPVVSVEGLEHGTYTVTIGVYTATTYTGDFAYLNRGNEFIFDAVRIYNTAKGNKLAETEYKLDGEFAPNIQEVRDLLITKDEFTAASNWTGAVWLDPYGENVTVGTYADTNVVGTYKAQGPNNEVYLAYGQGIAFQIESSTVPATVQIGAKSITGDSVTLNAYIGDANSTDSATLTQTIATSTDMYYQLSGDYAALFADGKTYVVVWNTGNNVLSITDIKVAYTTNPAEIVEVTYSEEMATFASNLLVTAVEQDDPDMTVAKGEDGKYYYYVADRVNEAYTGLVELDNGTWYVQDGQIVFNFDGAITFQGETYYIKAGRVSETTTGLYKYTGDWMYYTSGKVDTAYTGLAERSGMTVYVANGAVDFTKTGAVSHNGKLYYVRYGVVDSSFTGLVRADDGAWVYVTAGQQDTAYTGIVAHNGNNWYVENGTVNFQFTGTVADANGNWTVNRGQATAVNN